MPQQQAQSQQQQPPPLPVALAGTDSGDDMSSCVCSAIVQGKRLAVIATGAAVAEQEALRLANLMDHDQIAAAQRVLVVASDLPSRYA